MVPGAPDVVFADAHPFRLKVKNSGRLRGCPPCRMLIHNFLRWHYPHQVKGSEHSLPLSPRAPLFSAEYYCIFAKDCQEGLQRPGKERMIFSLKKRGVRWRGLRGSQPGFDPSPDLDHANVGSNCEKIEKWKYAGISTFFIACGGTLGAPPCIAL